MTVGGAGQWWWWMMEMKLAVEEEVVVGMEVEVMEMGSVGGLMSFGCNYNSENNM